MSVREASDPFRVEHDSLGSLPIPASAYYGIQTQRAIENFAISGVAIGTFPHLIRALAVIKKAAAQANAELGILPPPIAAAIERACDDLLAGRFHDQFPVDAVQGGAGTSTNMNANEVIANLALEHLGRAKGDYAFCHPNDHVNLSQSTNDVYPTAVRLSLYTKLSDLTDAMEELKQSFEQKQAEFGDVLKLGRTQLQDAVPLTLGQEMSTFAVMLGEDVERIHEAKKLLSEMNLGATAIGTGLNAPEGYAKLVREKLDALADVPFVTSANLVEATQDAGVFVQLSGVLKRTAVKLSKTCNDLRLLSSGPRAGLGEINLPPAQPGSSIMPGKVNPVIPEVVNQNLLSRHRRRHDRHHGRRGRPAPAQRLRAHHPLQPLPLGRHAQPRLPDARPALREGHHRQPQRVPPLRRAEHRPGHRLEPGARLRARRRGSKAGARDRQDHRRGRPRAEAAHPRGAGRAPRAPRHARPCPVAPRTLKGRAGKTGTPAWRRPWRFAAPGAPRFGGGLGNSRCSALAHDVKNSAPDTRRQRLRHSR